MIVAPDETGVGGGLMTGVFAFFFLRPRPEGVDVVGDRGRPARDVAPTAVVELDRVRVATPVAMESIEDATGVVVVVGATSLEVLALDGVKGCSDGGVGVVVDGVGGAGTSLVVECIVFLKSYWPNWKVS